MERILGITIFLSFLLLAHSNDFDITTFGGKPGSDISQALSSAWKEACNSPTSSKVIIPGGIFPLKEASLRGPCKAPVELQVMGTIQASANPGSITKGMEWIMVDSVDGFTLSGNGIFDGQGAQAWTSSDRCSSVESCSKNAHNFQLNNLKNSVIRDITSKNSKLFHFLIINTQNLTISRVTIDAPETSPNTDGVHVARSTGITIVDSTIKTGDDCVSIGDGSKQIHVTRVTCGPGHGISVGSLGKYQNEQPVEGIFITDCTFIKTMHGVRIKSWAGPQATATTVSDLHFENLKMQNVGVHPVGHPIIIDQEYCPMGGCNINPPSKVKISKVSFKGITGTSATPIIAKLICSKSLPCEGMEFGGVDLKYSGSLGPITSTCSDVKPIPQICAKPAAAA